MGSVVSLVNAKPEETGVADGVGVGVGVVVGIGVTVAGVRPTTMTVSTFSFEHSCPVDTATKIAESRCFPYALYVPVTVTTREPEAYPSGCQTSTVPPEHWDVNVLLYVEPSDAA